MVYFASAVEIHWELGEVVLSGLLVLVFRGNFGNLKIHKDHGRYGVRVLYIELW